LAKPKLALVGAQTLLGREIRDQATDFQVLAMDSTDAEGRTLVRDEDELALLSPMDEAAIGSAAVVMLAGDLESTAKVRKMRAEGLIDLTGLLEIDPGARLRSPLSEAAQRGAGRAPVEVIAHPGATMLALFLATLEASAPYARAVAQVWLPASEHGLEALSELQQQTVALLRFEKLKQGEFDTQAAFALLAETGEQSRHQVSKVAGRLRRNLSALLRGMAPMPSIQVGQAPVFHGLTVSVWVEFRQAPDLERVAALLAKAGMDVRSGDMEAPNNVSVANQDGVAVGGIEADGAHGQAAWFWLVADNHRLTGQNAMLVARERVEA
jgi:aspartate-semialdehyde dehydrogenase